MDYSPFSEWGRLRKLNEFVENESLFVCMCDVLEIMDIPDLCFSKIEIWADAKKLAVKFLSLKRPEFMVKESLLSLHLSYSSLSSKCRDVNLCAAITNTNIDRGVSINMATVVMTSLYAILYSQYKLIEEYSYLHNVLDKIKTMFKLSRSLPEIERLIDKCINNGEIISDYDYSKDEEHQHKNGEDNSNAESVTFERKNQKGETVAKTISAGDIAQIVMKYPWKEGMKKDQMQKMLSEITGLSEASFKNALAE